MKFKNQLLPLAISGLLTLGFSSCSDDDTNDGGGEMETQVTIGAFVLANPDSYSSLYSALEVTDLLGAVTDESANLTVFAPDNDAFSTFLTAAGFTGGLADVDTDEEIAIVKNILLNHVIGSELKEDDVKAATASAPFYGSTLAEGPENASGSVTNLSFVVNSDLMINGQTEITGPDAYDASNGVIHAVDSVIAEPLISTFATADDRLSTLVGALIAQDLVGTVDGLGTATVLAPLNSAFDAITVPTGDTLTDVLTYHVFSGTNYVASDIADTTTSITMVNQDMLGITPGPEFTGGSNTEAATVVVADIQASNGVVHVIDTVLLPPSDPVATK